jgi:hypothetical protein
MTSPNANPRRVRLQVLAAHPHTTVPTRIRIERALTRTALRQAA